MDARQSTSYLPPTTGPINQAVEDYSAFSFTYNYPQQYQLASNESTATETPTTSLTNSNRWSSSETKTPILSYQDHADALSKAIMLIQNGSVELRGAMWGDCIHWICNFEVIFQHKKRSEINILFYEQLAGFIEQSGSQHKQVYQLVCTLIGACASSECSYFWSFSIEMYSWKITALRL